jgi:curved DNA-binding protein CbpA
VTTTENHPNGFNDYYEILQLSPNADTDTISRVYRILVKRYHPDNRETGNERKFDDVVQAYRVLSDPEKRASYDVKHDENRASVLKIFEEASGSDSFEGDQRIFAGVLSLLYIARRRDPERGGLGVIQLERLLGCPAEHLEFHIWYLSEKNWIARQNNGQFAITASGIDRMFEENALVLRRDRMIGDASHADGASDSRFPKLKLHGRHNAQQKTSEVVSKANLPNHSSEPSDNFQPCTSSPDLD